MKDLITVFVERLKKINIEVKIAGNYPWIYLDEINGVRVTEKFKADHGFTIAFVNLDGKVTELTDISEIFKLIRRYLRKQKILSPLPEIGKTYNCFDDGKISESRRYEVEILDIVPFDKVDIRTKREWQRKVKNCFWLFEPITDYFIFADSYESDGDFDDDTPTICAFARTKTGDWYSIGDWMDSGLLDVDGSLTKSLE